MLSNMIDYNATWGLVTNFGPGNKNNAKTTPTMFTPHNAYNIVMSGLGYYAVTRKYSGCIRIALTIRTFPVAYKAIYLALAQIGQDQISKKDIPLLQKQAVSLLFRVKISQRIRGLLEFSGLPIVNLVLDILATLRYAYKQL